MNTNSFSAFLDSLLWGERVSSYLTLVCIILATLVLKKPLATLLTRLTGRLAVKYGQSAYGDLVQELVFKPMERLLQVVLYFVAINQLSGLLDKQAIDVHMFDGRTGTMSVSLGLLIDHIFLFHFILFLAQVVTRLVDFVYTISTARAEHAKDHSRQQLLPLFKEIAKLATWSLSALWILGGVFHVNVPALITGLGIGGIAIALAGKETVENFFAAFTLLSDKPFVAGEVIKIGELEGVVDRIGFRSTRIRNMDDAIIVIPNQMLVSQNVVNLTAAHTRALKLTTHIRYGVSAEVLRQIATEVEDAVKEVPTVTAPVKAIVDTMEKETIQLVVTYRLPHPMPPGRNLLQVKHEVNTMVLEVMTRHVKLGVGPAEQAAPQ